MAGQKLAIINNKNFSEGEEKDIKLKTGALHLHCLQIKEDSALVQMGDVSEMVSDIYELTLAGEIRLVWSAPKPEPPVAKPAVPAPVVQNQPAVRPPAVFIQPPPNPNQFAGNIFWKIGRFFAIATLILLAVIFIRAICVRTGTTKIQRPQKTKEENIGEQLLIDTLNKNFKCPHRLLNDLTLPKSDGGTTQIDHALITPTGIFVIETKHYGGWIFGKPKERQWTQCFQNKKSRFQNPLHQNYGHVKALQGLLNLPENNFRSLVVFTGTAQFKTDPGPNVIQLGDLISTLNVARPALFDENQMAQLAGKIEAKRKLRSAETEADHIDYVKKSVARKNLRPAVLTHAKSPAI